MNIKENRYKNTSIDQSKDTGMVIVFILLLVSYFYNNLKNQLIIIAIFVLLINIIYPKLLKPAAWLWFGLANLLSIVGSKIILTLIYIIILLPVGLFRKMIGKDSLLLKQWKKGSDSTFVIREHKFTPEDINFPY